MSAIQAEEKKSSAKELKEIKFKSAMSAAADGAVADVKAGTVEIADKVYVEFMEAQGHDMVKAKALRDDTALYIGAAHQAASFKALDVLKENTEVEKVETEIDMGFMGMANGVVHRNREVRVPQREGVPETTKIISGYNRLSFEFVRGTASSPLNSAIAAIKEKGAAMFGN